MRNLLQNRYKISTQLYAAIGAFVLLTIAASLVGVFFFARVGDAQSQVNEGTVPELAAAFGVSRYSGTLAAAGPRLNAAPTPQEWNALSANIDSAHASLEDELEELEKFATTIGGAETGQFQLGEIRTQADTLRNNLDAIAANKLKQSRQINSADAMWQELTNLRIELEQVLVPGIDDALFFYRTGYNRLGAPPASRDQDFSDTHSDRYRHLSALRSEGILATQLLVRASGVANASDVEPLLEEFESAKGRIESSLNALNETPIHGSVEPVFERLFEIGLRQGSGFDLMVQQRQLARQQETLLSDNQNIALGLVSEVTKLVAVSEDSAAAATLSSEQAFLTGRTLLIIISGASVVAAVLIAWLFVGRVLLRRLEMLSEWMRKMAGGDLEAQAQADIGGKDEISDMAAAMEVFRQNALEVQRLNLVEEMAEELLNKNEELETAMAELDRAQDQIVMREKLAALGELTAGVAHEIRNPLNFVKNFSEGSADLLEELQETLDESIDKLDEKQQELIRDISSDLSENMERIRTHGERADRIVHDMLMMGRDSGEHELTDINRLLDQNARLAYHSARATNQNFQMEIVQTGLDPEMGQLEVIPQDLGRVFLNMVSNACDATDMKRAAPETDSGYMPTLWLSTKRDAEHADIIIKDNGLGIPEHLVDQIFNPFFTTKPTDRGTGLGLAITSDIVRQHGGTILVDTEAGEYTQMTIRLPLEPFAAETAVAEAAPASAEPVAAA